MTEPHDAVDEVQAAKSGEDRKAAAALATLDARGGDDSGNAQVDKEAASKAMKSIPTTGAGANAPKKEVKKVKVEAADVSLLMDQLDLSKPKATELLKAHDGQAVPAMKAFVANWETVQ